MNYIKEGNYYTLHDISIRLGISRQAVLDRARKLGIQPLKLGRLMVRYHEEDVKKIMLLGIKRHANQG